MRVSARFLLFFLLVFPLLAQSRPSPAPLDSTAKSAVVAVDTTIKQAQSAVPDSASWFEKNPALTALIGVIVGALLSALAAWWLARRGEKKAPEVTHKTERAKLETERDFETSLQSQNDDTIKQQFLDFVRGEHGRIKLFGFLSHANIDVHLIDVFVSLRMSEAGHEIGEEKTLRGEMRDQLTPPEALENAISRNKALLVLGGPGSGKTTLLKYFAICCLDAKGRERIRLRRPLLPIFVPLRQFDSTKTFTQALSDWAKEHEQRVSPELFDQWMRHDGALVLLDGLDEVSDLAARRQICERIDTAIATYAKSTFVITCRFTGYREAEGVALQRPHVRVDVRDLDARQQQVYLEQWFRATLLERVDGREALQAARQQQVERDAAARAGDIMTFLSKEENRSLREMAGIPILLQIMAIISKEQGSLSDQRVELYNRAIDFLLNHRDMARQPPIEPLMNATKARLVLQPLALWMQAEWQKDEAPREQVEERIAAKLEEVRPGTKPLDFLENIRDRAGVLVGSGADTYTFQHKSFREYLAAVEIAKQRRTDLLVENFGQDWWQETLLFAAGMSSPEILPAFLERFLKHEKNAGPTSTLLLQMMREAAGKPVAPFEKMLLNRKLAWQKRYNALQCLRLMPSEPVKQLVQRAWQQEKSEMRVKQLAEELLFEWKLRRPEPAAVAEVAGGMLAPAGPSWRNPFELEAEYVRIPGGRYRFSVTKLEVTVPELYFAKYPVTNKLYRRFIAYLREEKGMAEALQLLPMKTFAQRLLAGENEIKGYFGEDHNQLAPKLVSKFDDDKRFNGDDQPVVGVTWYAAMAYCHWLSALQKANSKGQKETIIYRLPAEEEWEWAASGGKRKYPWGDPEPDETRANYDGKVGQTTPVGAYPAGATPEGLQDMAGNVWEWMGNKYAPSSERRALRGGSWDYTAGDLPCAARYNNSPDYLWLNFGFRVVAVQSVFDTLKL